LSASCHQRISRGVQQQDSVHQVSRKRLSFFRQLPTENSVLLRQTRSDAVKSVPLKSEKNPPTKATAALHLRSVRRSPCAPLVPRCAGVSDRRPAPTKAARTTLVQKKCILPADRVLMVLSHKPSTSE